MNDEMVHHLKEIEDTLNAAYKGKMNWAELIQLIDYTQTSAKLGFALGRVHGISEVGEKDAVNR